MKKELFKIFENYTIEDVPEAVKEDMITTINAEGTSFNSFLVATLRVLTNVIEDLETGTSVVATSDIDVILAFEITAMNLVLLVEHEKESFKIDSNELESIVINCKSILNAVGTFKELQAKNLEKLTPEELLVILTT